MPQIEIQNKILVKQASGRISVFEQGNSYECAFPSPGPLPRGEGDSHPPAQIQRARRSQARQMVLPLPKGEGRGEGELGGRNEGGYKN